MKKDVKIIVMWCSLKKFDDVRKEKHKSIVGGT